MLKKNDAFFDRVARIIEQARVYVGRTADLTICIAYYEIGYILVEREQDGKTRAKYGHGMLAELSSFLTKRFGRGFSVANLKNARQFYIMYSDSLYGK